MKFNYIIDDKIIDTIDIEHIPDQSCYNHNIYKLARPIKGLEVKGDFIYSKYYKDHLDSICILEECDDDYSACYTLGYLDQSNDKRKKKLEFKPVMTLPFGNNIYYQDVEKIIVE